MNQPLLSGEEQAFGWTDAFLLGFAPMDDTHREFVELVQPMLACPAAELPGHLEAFAEHAHRHFDQERDWMLGTDFPAAQCHIDEHQAVLKSVEEVLALLREGRDPAIARSLAEELARWFPGHADYMDAPLSQWMVKRRHGGAPVVIKRNVSRA